MNGKDSRWFASRELAELAIDDWHRDVARQHEEDCYEDEGEAAYGREE